MSTSPDDTAPILPPATIGIIGGGQLGRMLAMAARAMGYRIAIMDPDPDCPSASVADEVIVGGYDDVAGAVRLAEASVVVTYELEHVAAAVGRAVAGTRPLRPSVRALEVTQDRLAERRFLEGARAGVAPWLEVRTKAELESAAGSLRWPLRLKAAIGGYDGRGQVRLAGPTDVAPAWHDLERSANAAGLLLERELDFACELSVVVARGLDGRAVPFAPGRNRHDAGILFETLVPAPLPVTAAIAGRAQELAVHLAEALDVVGTLTVEMFLLRDGALVVNELAPRVHNSGHWTIEGAATSQFEQHIRAICGLPLGDPTAHGSAAMINILGTGERRAAHLDGVPDALADPGAHLHLYDKRQVFERRKMGHLTVLATTPEEALERAVHARERLTWA
ncbi:MAG TPA: 5-(carboxyamino)imidazole ribonucleotide synthase [Candidatus Limnocylindrales bacterium]